MIVFCNVLISFIGISDTAIPLFIAASLVCLPFTFSGSSAPLLYHSYSISRCPMSMAWNPAAAKSAARTVAVIPKASRNKVSLGCFKHDAFISSYFAQAFVLGQIILLTDMVLFSKSFPSPNLVNSPSTITTFRLFHIFFYFPKIYSALLFSF